MGADSNIRLIYLDEILDNEELKNSAQSLMNEFNDANRGFSKTTQYGLINGWISEEQIQESCEEEMNYRKVLMTQACYPIFGINLQ